MGKVQTLLMILGIICTCTCDGRTDCGNHAQISLLTSIHDDPSCRKLSAKGVLIYEGAKLLTEIHNNKSGGYDIGKWIRCIFIFLKVLKLELNCDLYFLFKVINNFNILQIVTSYHFMTRIVDTMKMFNENSYVILINIHAHIEIIWYNENY